MLVFPSRHVFVFVPLRIRTAADLDLDEGVHGRSSHLVLLLVGLIHTEAGRCLSPAWPSSRYVRSTMRPGCLSHAHQPAHSASVCRLLRIGVTCRPYQREGYASFRLDPAKVFTRAHPSLVRPFRLPRLTSLLREWRAAAPPFRVVGTRYLSGRL